MKFFKGHGLGNDYLAVDGADLELALSPPAIRLICDRNHGIGSDGILLAVDSAHDGVRCSGGHDAARPA